MVSLFYNGCLKIVQLAILPKPKIESSSRLERSEMERPIGKVIFFNVFGKQLQ